jgi:hypothetical protein
MTPNERERRHRAAIARIARVQVVAGRGDCARVDHEATLLEQARMMDEELCAFHATERALQAFEALLQCAESREPQARCAAEFIAAVWNRRPLPLELLRQGGPRMGDLMLEVLDGVRFGRLDPAGNLSGGARRVARVLMGRTATA